MLRLVVALLCLLPLSASAYWQSRLQVGSTCAAFTYPGGQVYQSLGFTDSWSPTDSSNTPNAALSPDCTVDAAAETEDNTTNLHFLFKSVTTTISAANHVSTIFVKRGSGTRNFYLQFQDSTFSKTARVVVNLGTCAISSSFATGTGWADVSQTAALQSNGYCKIVFTTTLVLDTAINFSVGMADGSFNLSYLGDGTSSLNIWGLDFR